jgi:hypothetical protein
LPEEWLIERSQQVGTNSGKPLSPSFVAICFTIAAVFRDLRYIFVTEARRAAFRSSHKQFRIDEMYALRLSFSFRAGDARLRHPPLVAATPRLEIWNRPYIFDS